MRISLIKAGEKRENIKTFDLKEGGCQFENLIWKPYYLIVKNS